MTDITVKLVEEISDVNSKEATDNNSTEKNVIDSEGLGKLESRESINNDEPYTKMSRDELLEVSRSSNSYISSLETKLANLEGKKYSLALNIRIF